MSYIGNSPAPFFTAVTTDVFSANGTGTDFTLSRRISNLADIEVIVDNIQQNPFSGSYSVSGDTLSFSSAPSSGSNNVTVTYRQATIGSTIPTPNTVGNSALRSDLSLTGNTTTQHILPAANVTYDIGSDTMRYRDLYLSGNTIQLGAVSLSTNNDTFVVANTTGGVLPSELGNTTITGTLTANDTTIVGSANVTGVLAAGNTTVTGTIVASDKLQIGNQDSVYTITASSSDSGGTRAYIVNSNNSTSGLFLASKNTSNVTLATSTLRLTNTGAVELYNGNSGSEDLSVTITTNGGVAIGANNTPSSGIPLYVKGGASGWTIIERSSKQLYVNPNYSDLNLYAQVSPSSQSNIALSLSSREDLNDIFIKTNGLVGIGNTDPLEKLHLTGKYRQDSSSPNFITYNNTNAGDYFLIKFEENGTHKGYMGLGGSTQSGLNSFAAYTADGFSLNHDGAGKTIISNRGTSKTIWLCTGNEAESNFPTIILKNKITTFPTQPRFYAYGVTGDTYAHNSYWIFPSTRVNTGSHYNTSTGIFTVPTDGGGTYYFIWGNIAGNTDTVYRYYLRVNNSNVGDIHNRIDNTATGSEYGHNSARALMLNLSAGDTVRIFYLSDSGAGSYPFSNETTNDYPYFGGYLLG